MMMTASEAKRHAQMTAILVQASRNENEKSNARSIIAAIDAKVYARMNVKSNTFTVSPLFSQYV
jgi:hypothetical protein